MSVRILTWMAFVFAKPLCSHKIKIKSAPRRPVVRRELCVEELPEGSAEAGAGCGDRRGQVDRSLPHLVERAEGARVLDGAGGPEAEGPQVGRPRCCCCCQYISLRITGRTAVLMFPNCYFCHASRVYHKFARLCSLSRKSLRSLKLRGAYKRSVLRASALGTDTIVEETANPFF